MSRPAVPTPRDAWQHAALVAAAVTLVLVADVEGPWRAAVEVPVFAAGLAAVHAALRRHRTAGAVVWRGLGAALVAFAASSAAETAQLAGIAPGINGSLETALDIAGYGALVVAALGQLAVGRRGLDREAWIDTASLVLAAGLTVIAFSGGVDNFGAGFTDLRIGISLLSALVLLVCVPLAAHDNGRSVSAMGLLAAGVLVIAGYGARIVAGPLTELSFVDGLPLFAVAALVLAGRHPSVVALGRHADSEKAVTTGRVVGLGAALLVSPMLLILWSIRDGGTGYVLGVGSALLTALALWRLATINSSREVTRAALAASEARLQVLLENAADVIAIVDGGGSIVFMSPAVQSLLGHSPADYLGRKAIELADPRDQPRLRSALTAAGAATGEGGSFVDTDVRLRHSSGGTRWVEMRISGRVEAAGIEGWVVNLREVTDRKLFEDELRRQARTDALTGLLNRSAFSDRLAAATLDIDPAAPPAVLFVDVDDFKSVNDTTGHAAGDELLTIVAARLSADVRGDDVVARLGGDEFAVLLADADAARLREVADRLLTSLRAPMTLAGSTVTMTASIGGALGVPGDTAERLLHRADTAMYAAKRSGKNSSSLLENAGA